MFYDVKRCHLVTIKFTQWPSGNDNNANNNEWYITHGLQYDIVVAGVLESCHNDTLQYLKSTWCFRSDRALLTHWGRDKMAANFLMTFSNAFSWMKICAFWLKYHWKMLFLRVQLTIIQYWFRQWLAADQTEPMMVSLLTHLCVTRPEWVNTLQGTDGDAGNMSARLKHTEASTKWPSFRKRHFVMQLVEWKV